MPHNKASELVLNHGWTKTKPIVVPVAVAEPTPAPVVSTEELDAIFAPVEPVDTVEADASIDDSSGWRGTTGRRARKSDASEESAEA